MSIDGRKIKGVEHQLVLSGEGSRVLYERSDVRTHNHKKVIHCTLISIQTDDLGAVCMLGLLSGHFTSRFKRARGCT